MANYSYIKHFTIAEANAKIRYLRPLLEELRQLSIVLTENGFDIYQGRYKPGYHPGTRDEFPPRYRRMLGLIHQLNDDGIEVKGIEQGLVDFPALRPNGEEVFLCWKLDEDYIEFWHPLQGGMKGREHIDDF